ncbi:unnamed protein product, partial [Rhizoctonia solani]
MRRFVPGNSRRVDRPRSQSRPPRPPGEINVDDDGQKEQSVREVENSDSELDSGHQSKELEVDEAPRPKQGHRLRRTRAVFTSDEIAKMSHEELVQSLKDIQRGDVSNELAGGSEDLTLADQPNTAVVPGNLDTQGLAHALKKHCRDTFRTTTGMSDGNGVRLTVRDAQGVVQYWTTNSHGVKELTPSWGETFEANRKAWGAEYLRQFRVESDMPALNRAYLKTVPDKEIFEVLKRGVWRSYSDIAKKMENGTFDQSQAAKRSNNRENGRRSTKAAQRTKASQDTCVDNKLADFKFLYRPRAQSPPVADTLDSSREIVLVPSFVADEVLTIKDSLDARAASLSKGTSSKVKSLVYVKVDGPVPKLDGEQWPDWAIGKTWKEDHPNDYSKSINFIDPTRTIMPNIAELTGRYKTQPRQFLDSMPAGAQLLEANHRRSATPALIPRANSLALAGSHSSVNEHGSVELAPAQPSAPATPVEAEHPRADPESPLPLPPPPPVSMHDANQSYHPHDYQLKGGHYVDGQFISAPLNPGATDVLASNQVFGMLIDPVLMVRNQNPVAEASAPAPLVAASTPGPKRTTQASQDAVPLKRRKKALVPIEPPRRSARHQKNEANEGVDTKGSVGGKLMLKIS